MSLFNAHETVWGYSCSSYHFIKEEIKLLGQNLQLAKIKPKIWTKEIYLYIQHTLMIVHPSEVIDNLQYNDNHRMNIGSPLHFDGGSWRSCLIFYTFVILLHCLDISLCINTDDHCNRMTNVLVWTFEMVFTICIESKIILSIILSIHKLLWDIHWCVFMYGFYVLTRKI